MRATSLLSLLFLAPLGTKAQRKTISKDATCGGNKSYTCLGSAWGSCCSKYGWCGSNKDYCSPENGCNTSFGECDKAVKSSSVIIKSSSTRQSSASPTTSQQPISTDARCGPKFGGHTCQGSRWGNCCSQYSYCGSTIDYCEATTCQKGFGYCNAAKSSSKLSSTSIKSSSSSKVLSSSTVVHTTSSSVSSSISSSSSSSIQSITGVPSSSTQTGSSASVSASPVSSTISSASSAPASSTAVDSSSAIVPSSTSAVPAGPTCSSIPNCEALAGPLTSCMQATSGKCFNGYQQQCSTLPSTGSIIKKSTPVTSADGDDCASTCTADRDCIAFTFAANFAGQYSCNLYSSITGISRGFYNTYVKVCDDVGTSSSALPSSSSTVIPTSSTISALVSPSVPRSSTISASPSASACPYLQLRPGLSCPTTTEDFESICPSTSQVCRNNVIVACSATLSGTPVYNAPFFSLSDCIGRCQIDPQCVGATFGEQGNEYPCQLYSTVDTVIAGATQLTSFRRVCPQSQSVNSLVTTSTLSGSSSIQQSSGSVASSSSNAQSSSSATISSTAVSSTAPSASAAATCSYYQYPSDQICNSVQSFSPACVSGAGGCKDGFSIHCGKIATSIETVGSNWIIGGQSQVSPEQCIGFCRNDKTCDAATYSSTDGLIGYCQLYKKTSNVRDYTSNDASYTTFRKLCPGVSGSSSAVSSSVSSSSVA